MPAYMIVEVETTDEALMAEYRKHTPGLVAKYGGKFIVRGGKCRTLEGGWTMPANDYRGMWTLHGSWLGLNVPKGHEAPCIDGFGLLPERQHGL